MSRLLRLYPPRWRARYEVEFRALLEEQRPTFADRIDILRGALGAWLNPRYGGSIRRPMLWLAVAAIIVLVAGPAMGVFQSTPVQASPRYPVTLSLGPDIEVNTLQFVIADVQRTVPHLILSVDSRGSWLLTGAITERSSVGHPGRIVHAPEIESSAWQHAWDFGRIQPGQVVWLTLDIDALHPKAFGYSIRGYGQLTIDGKPNPNAPLTNPSAQANGTMSFGTVGPTQYPYAYFWPRDVVGCGDRPRNGFHVCDVEDNGSDFYRLDFRNDARPIPHFILQIDSLHWWTLDGITASVRSSDVPRLFTPLRLLSSPRSVYTLDFGPLPRGAYLHIRLVISRSGQGGVANPTRVFLPNPTWAFASLTPSGKPDPKTLIFGTR
jgi:hypothetical protein